MLGDIPLGWNATNSVSGTDVYPGTSRAFHLHVHAAVHVQHVTGDVRRILARQKLNGRAPGLKDGPGLQSP